MSGSGVRTDTVRSSLDREGFLVVTASKDTENLASLENKMERVMAPSSWDSKPSAFDEMRRDSSSDERRIMSAFDDLRRDSSKKGSLFGGSLYDDKVSVALLQYFACSTSTVLHHCTPTVLH